MAGASIGVSRDVKKTLEAAKPDGMPWNEFFEVLLHAVDTGRFIRAADSKQLANEADVIDRARARYASHAASPSSAISGAELRRRIHLRRLMDSMDLFRGSLRIAADNPSADAKAIDSALADLDEQIHSTRPLLVA